MSRDGVLRTPSRPGTVGLRSRRGTALITATVLASLVAFVDANLVNVAVPAIGESLHAGVAELQWIVTGYLVTVAALLLLAGGLADEFGRRRMLGIGLGVMLIASLACAAAPNTATLIAARLVQGVGGAIVVPSSLALLNGTLRPEDRARGIGVWAGIATLGTTLGPYAGGWLIDHGSWRWIFLLNVPLVLAAVIVLRALPETRRTRSGDRFDVLGALLGVIGLGGVIVALTAAPAAGWGSLVVVGPGLVGLVALGALAVAERRATVPMVRPRMFRSQQFDGINAATVLLYGALAAAGYLVVLQCQFGLGYSATEAGAALIPESVVFLLVSPLAGALAIRISPRWMMAVGILVVAAGFCWLAAATRGAPYFVAILPGAVLWGLGIGLTVPPLTAGVLAAVDDSDLGQASAVNDAASRVGGVVVIALVPVLLGVGDSESLAAPLAQGYGTTMLVMAGLAVVAAGIVAVFVSGAQHRGAATLAVTPRLHSCALPERSRAE